MSAVLERLLDGDGLDEKEAEAMLGALASGELAPPLAGALLAALRAKGESPAELRGLVRGMRALARPAPIAGREQLVDCVGTGGDGSHSINLSTGAALIAAAAGQPVAKHGNRAVSSRAGSADLLEVLGLPLPIGEEAASACLAETGFTFLFAPHYHPAMRALAELRRSLGVRTVFNLLGPLCNPAAPGFLMVGAYSADAARLIAQTLAGLEQRRAFVVHGEPGWDEATPVGPFLLLDVMDGMVHEERRDPAKLGLPRCPPGALKGGSAPENAHVLHRVFEGERGARRDALTLNAALVLELTGRAPDAAAGLDLARAAIDDGRATHQLESLAAFGREVRRG